MANRLTNFKSDGTPIKSTEKHQIKREKLKSRRGDKVRNISVNLKDVDRAMIWYFDNIIRPDVLEGGERYKVPIRYASAERWKSVQKDGVFRDIRGRVILPVMVIRRSSMEKDTSMVFPPNDQYNLKWAFKKTYSDRNRYDRFSVQKGLIPTTEYFTTAVPDFRIMKYECIIYTDYVEQMNKITEKISHSEGRYWGEPGKYQFRTTIETFDDAIEMETGNDRLVKCSFTLNTYGYLLPDNFNYQSLTDYEPTPGKIVIGEGDGLGNIETINGVKLTDLQNQ